MYSINFIYKKRNETVFAIGLRRLKNDTTSIQSSILNYKQECL